MILTPIANDSWGNRVASYHNTQECNDRIHREFTQYVKTVPFLTTHRQHIEAYQLGFGDPAFHYLWYLLIPYVAEQFSQPNVLEIGVFKGQVISLWSLIAHHLNLSLSISGITPLQGNPLPQSTWKKRLKKLISSRFRADIDAGNFYPEEDYRVIIQRLFQYFDLNVESIRLIEGYSTDSHVQATVQDETFSLIYIDGDHTYEGVMNDLQSYAPKVQPGGFLVMDDAGYYQPGTVFWKGYESVSRACELTLPMMGFTNVLNVGHNRVYQRGY